MNGDARRLDVSDMAVTEGYEFRGFHIPARMMPGLRRYVEDHVRPGGFLTAVLENNLREAVGNADEENMANLPAYVGYLWNEMPMNCWGSPEKVAAWLNPEKEGESQ